MIFAAVTSKSKRRVDDGFAQVDEKFREVLGHLDEIYRRLERLEQEYHMIRSWSVILPS